MDASTIALIITAVGGFVTAAATAAATLKQSNIAVRAAERAEKQAEEAERRAAASEKAFADLLRPTLYQAPTTDAQRARFAAAGKVLQAGAAAMRQTVGTKAFPTISGAHELFAQQAVGLLPDRAFPEGTALVGALARVRLCATRAAGAASSTGDVAAWAAELDAALRGAELALVTAITATPDYAEEWQQISRRHQID